MSENTLTLALALCIVVVAALHTFFAPIGKGVVVATAACVTLGVVALSVRYGRTRFHVPPDTGQFPKR